MAAVLRFDGNEVRSGESFDFDEYTTVQATVMPVVSLEDKRMRCWGTAVCIGAAGWFLTARHVVQPFLDRYGTRDDGKSGLFILWGTDERLSGPNDYLGAPLPIVHCHRHGSADLASLTVGIHPATAERLRVATLALRMPAIGEPLAFVGYRHMSLNGEVTGQEPATLEYERTLTVSVGDVTEPQHDRLHQGLRGSPGVVTNAPVRCGMSGGPVFDHTVWRSSASPAARCPPSKTTRPGTPTPSFLYRPSNST